MPKNAATSIQKSAPGPPVPIAVATPTMLPVPIVADSAVQSAPNCETSPFASPDSSPANMMRKAFFRLKTCRRRRMNVSRSPVKRIAAMSGTPQTQSSIVLTQVVSCASQLLVASTVWLTGAVWAASGVEAMVLRAVVTTVFVIGFTPYQACLPASS